MRAHVYVVGPLIPVSCLMLFFFFLSIQLHPFLMVIGLILIGGEGKESKLYYVLIDLFSKAFSCALFVLQSKYLACIIGTAIRLP